jgi:cobalt-zinc-cadmium efflux system protein
VTGSRAEDCVGYGKGPGPQAHDHHHHHHHHHTAPAGSAQRTRRLGIVLALTSVYMVAEAVGGWMTNSLALLSDAGHMLTDVAAIALAMLAIWFGSRPAPPEKTYGYYRIEILAAFVNGVTLVVLALYIIYEAYERILAPPTVESGEMIAIATGGLAVNLVSAWILMGKHDHGPRTLNEHGAFLHVVGDALGSVGAIVAGLFMLFGEFYVADPIVSIVIAILIVYSSYELIREAVNVLLEGTPSHINIAAVKGAMLGIDGILDVHDLHVWSITSGRDALSAHVVCDDDGFTKEKLEAVRRALRSQFGIGHITIQLETPDFQEEEHEARV